MVLKTTKPTEELKDDENVVETVKAVEDLEPSEAETSEVETLAQSHEEDVTEDSAGESSSSTEVAQKQENLPVTSGQSEGLKAILEDLRRQGFDGIDLEFGTFPLLSLDKGEFKINDKEVGKATIQGTALTSTRKYCYRNEGAADKDKEQVWEESPEAHLIPNSEVAKRIAEWEAKGWSFTISEYVNILFHVFSFPAAPEYAGSWVMLSVPPTSKKSYSAAAIKCKTNGYDVHQCLMEITVGEKIKGNRGDWYPWNFAVRGSLKKFGLKVSFGVKNEDF